MSGGMGDRLQEVWREIVQAEHARGSAMTGPQSAYEEALRLLVEAIVHLAQADEARGSASAGAHADYEEALRRFRHMQLEAFTVTLGELEILREQVDDLHEAVARLQAQVTELERVKARENGA